MHAQFPSVAASEDQALIELDLALLDHIGGGTPKGTWSEADAAVADTDPTPKGTW